MTARSGTEDIVELIGLDLDMAPLRREQAVARLIAAEPEIRALGVERLALFGSVVRDEARADSDVDVLVHFVASAKTYGRFFAWPNCWRFCSDARSNW